MLLRTVINLPHSCSTCLGKRQRRAVTDQPPPPPPPPLLFFYWDVFLFVIGSSFLLDLSLIIAFSWPESLSARCETWLVGFVKVFMWISIGCYISICQNWCVDFSMLFHRFVKFDVWISLEDNRRWFTCFYFCFSSPRDLGGRSRSFSALDVSIEY